MSTKGKRWTMPTEAVKARALTLLRTHLKNGYSRSKSVELVGRDFGYTASTIHNWDKVARNIARAVKNNGITTTKTSTVKDTGFVNSVTVKSTNGAFIKLTLEDIDNIAKLAGHIH